MRRAATTAATRQAVINSARELLATVPWREFTLEAVAAGAGVTRVTVYNQVRNKAGLLDAVLTELTVRTGMDQDFESIEIDAWDESGKPLQVHAPAPGQNHRAMPGRSWNCSTRSAVLHLVRITKSKGAFATSAASHFRA